MGAQPFLFAQSGKTTIIDLEMSSDEDIFQALQSASDIEFIKKNDMGKEPDAVQESVASQTPEQSAEEIPATAETESAIGEEKEINATEIEFVLVEGEPPADETEAEVVLVDEKTEELSPADNQYLEESQRLLKLAQETYEYGDYDTAVNFAQEAMFYALLSDVNVAIALAKDRIDWAISSGADKQYPYEFDEAQTWYGVSLTARDGEEWENALDAANKVKELLAYIAGGPGSEGGTPPLPAQYTVRSWLTVKDCFWNIAARSWVYGNPRQWRVLYNANKSKLPNPDNPNLIEPGTVLDIPSIKGETRQGEWSSDRTYGSIP
jgi:nucleoid-associated protein YgaU